MQSRKPKSLKIANTKVLREYLRMSDKVSIAEASESIGLSKTTVRKILDHFVETGIVFSAGKGASTDEGGKRPELFVFNQDYGYVISLHVTPDMLLAAMTNLRADIIDSKVVLLEKDVHVLTVVRHLVEAIRVFMRQKASSASKLLGVVIALPGLVNPDDGVSIYSPHYPAWGRNVPLKQMLLRELGEDFPAPIFLDCVNRYQAFAEQGKGSAAGAGNYLIIDALDEGLGGGLILNGSMHRGAHYISGEVGHMVLSPNDETRCICGARGCFEAMVSAKRVLCLVREGYSSNRQSALFRTHSPEQVTLEEVSEAAAAGDPFARSIIDDVAGWFAQGINNITMVTDPELIILQGVYTRAGDYFVERVQAQLDEMGGLPDVDKPVRLEYSIMDEKRGVVGAAAFVISHHFGSREPQE